jgi:hypothetical protein
MEISNSNSKKEMHEIRKEDAGKYNIIGTATGFSLGFCVFIAQKHAPKFFDRAVGYVIEKNGLCELMSQSALNAGLPEEKQKYISVSFYEEKLTK